MPELPDVDAFRRVLAEHAVGKRITSVDVHDAGVLHGTSAQNFAAVLEGRQFAEPERRGKWLLAALSGGPILMFHFGMTGALSWAEDDEEAGRFERVVFAMGTGRLVYRDLRKLRGLWLADDEDEVERITGPLGPDALGLSAKTLDERLAGHRGPVKTVMTDQKVIAGVGNMLADETLWQARLHPSRRYDDLDLEDRHKLSRSLQKILRLSVEAGEIPRRNGWLSCVRGEKNAACPRCGTALRTTRIGGRTALWCPHCQPEPVARKAKTEPARAGQSHSPRTAEPSSSRRVRRPRRVA
ncbi:MAG: Formamidopyrimidine-DNA glycosylase catalytic domain protein [Acidimicrobiaceae bacterium]|nr:Formamidopyrimidine-DNA glycosylase catalytic domain protein [Acidimicrobiaceae bacterium]